MVPEANTRCPDSLRLDLVAEPGSVGPARRAVADFAIGAGALDSLAADVALAVSEAVTNVVVHAYRNRELPGRVRVVARRVRQELLVTVGDDGDGLHPRTDSPGLGLGLGLGIIARIAHTVDFGQRPGGGTELAMCFLLVSGPVLEPATPPGRAGTARSRGPGRRGSVT
jgi:anti-sigma regulatory factor (Ser/Thr protein kinase)